ncbi:apolipoprotein D-like [Anastrepha ludens]|uniref:apolipoprotein D-like n=1 Tax=Anastrepha ludens TaxID=28586 RepID=UPI0023B102E9|nr:apolipoprotein D-like [Anastrepha ludens]
MQKTILPIIALALLGLANAQIRSKGACPRPAVQSNFNLYAYMGTFYEYAKYPSAFEGNSKCVRTVHTQKSKNVMHKVDTLVDPTTGKSSDYVATATQISNGKFTFHYSGQVTPTNFWVLFTDYISYAVVYTCEPASGNTHNTLIRILTRERVPSGATVAKAKNVVSSSGFDPSLLTVTDQSNC